MDYGNVLILCGSLFQGLSVLGFRCRRSYGGGRCRPVRIGACARARMTRLNGLAGQRFGHLVVRERTPHRNKRNAYWLCECDCGGNKEASTHSLRRGAIVSCDCLRISKSDRCSVEGCTTKPRCKGLCLKHYQRARRHDGDTSDGPRITKCTIEGCGGEVNARGLCRKHYQRARRRDRKAPERPRIVRACNVEGCRDKAITHGLCNKHYIRARRHNGDTSDRPRITTCTIEGCGGKVRTKGLCAKHYMWALRHDRNISDRPRIVRACSVEGCGSKVEAKGLCHKHYQRALRHAGDTSDRPRADPGSQTDQQARQAAGPSARADAASPHSLRGLIERADSTGRHPQEDGGLLGPRPRTEVITDATWK
jgi:hypothetical protein